MMPAIDEKIALLLSSRKILVIDDEHYTRKVIKTLLMTMVVTSIQEATDGHDVPIIMLTAHGERSRVVN